MIETMKQALDVLIDRGQLSPDEFKEKKNEAITSLRKAIAEAEKQETKPCSTCEALARTVMMDQGGTA